MTYSSINTSFHSSPPGFQAQLFKAADKLWGKVDPSEYKHVVSGLIFLKYG